MFSPGEQQQLHLLPPEQQQRAFFVCWTRKEAYAKEAGQGILTRFDSLSVDADPDEPKPDIRFNGFPQRLKTGFGVIFSWQMDTLPR